MPIVEILNSAENLAQGLMPIAIVLIAWLLQCVHKTLTTISKQIHEDAIASAGFRGTISTRVDAIEKTVDRHDGRISILEKKRDD